MSSACRTPEIVSEISGREKSISRISAPRADDSGVTEKTVIRSGVHRSRADSLRREQHPAQAEAGAVDSIRDRSARGPRNGLARAQNGMPGCSISTVSISGTLSNPRIG